MLKSEALISEVFDLAQRSPAAPYVGRLQALWSSGEWTAARIVAAVAETGDDAAPARDAS